MTIVPMVGERDTEFYILDMEGTAEYYPRELAQGEESSVLLGVVNHEHETAVYRVEVKFDQQKQSEIGPISLSHGDKWEQGVTFTQTRARTNQKVEFLLYKQGESEVYRSLFLWVNLEKLEKQD